MNKKKVTIILMVFLAIFSTIILVVNKNNVEITNEVGNKPKKNNNLLTMNLEQTAGAGDYKTVTQSGWPTEGYKFNMELSRCENGSELSWDDENKIVLMSGNSNDKCYVYFDIWIPSITDYCTSGTDLATCVKNFGDQGSSVSSIYIHDSSLANGAGDNSYRYAGANPNNYVCFGSDASPCPTDNLYRIIGVIDGKIKLIKSLLAGSNLLGTDGTYTSNDLYKWSNLSSCPSSTAYLNANSITFLANKNIIAVPEATFGCSNWKISELNTVNLNKNFLETISSDFKNIIFDNTWIVGDISVNAKIGLINKNDYIFAGSHSEFWNKSEGQINGWGDDTLTTEEYNQYILNNWIYNGGETCSWTLEYQSDYYQSNVVMGLITNTGYVFSTGEYKAGIATLGTTLAECSIYPTFYLKSDILYKSGIGTISNPIRIN